MKKVTIYDVAKNINVSTSTVSRVINNDSRISEAVREKVRKELKRLKYMPNQHAKNLSNGKNKNVGIFFSSPLGIESSMGHIIMNKKISGVCSEMNKHGYNISLFIDNYTADDIWNAIMNNNLSGILTINRISDIVNQKILDYGIPHVQVNWHHEKLPVGSYVSVECDMSKMILMMLEHLYERGYRDIEVISTYERKLHTERTRVVVDRYNEEKPDVSVLMTTEIAGRRSRSREVLYDYLDRGLKRAYIFTYYEHSFWAMDYFNKRGLRVPEDVAIVTQDYDELFDLYRPALTGARIPIYEMGALAAKKLISMINGNKEESEFLDPVLLIGEST